jgi:hypothetical protein
MLRINTATAESGEGNTHHSRLFALLRVTRNSFC